MRPRKPFRFLNTWVLAHDNFKDLVISSWNVNGDVLKSLNCMAKASTLQNRYVFGHIGHKKKKLEARVSGFHIALDKNNSNYLRNVGVQSLADYESLLY